MMWTTLAHRAVNDEYLTESYFGLLGALVKPIGSHSTLASQVTARKRTAISIANWRTH